MSIHSRALIGNNRTPEPLPMVGTAPLAAWGLTRVIPGYRGPLARAVRASDSATMDISMTKGVANTAAVEAWAAGTTAKIDKVYDQTGGGNDLTQTTDSKRPLLYSSAGRPVPFPTGVPALTMDGAAFDIPVGIAPSSRLVTVVAVTKSLRRTPNSIMQLYITGGSTNGLLLGYMTQGAGLKQQIYQKTTSDTGYENTPFFTAYRSGASATTLNQNGVKKTGTVAVANSLAGGSIGGNSFGDTISFFDMGAIVMYSAELSDADVTALNNWSDFVFGTSKQATDLVVVAGDSISAGNGSTFNRNWPNLAWSGLKKTVRMVNLGVPFQATPAMAAQYAAAVSPLYNASNTKNILAVLQGSNDLATGGTPAQAYTDISNYCTTARTTGFKVVVATMLPRTGITEADRITLNANIRANWATFADALADVGNDPTMGVAGAQNNATYYDPDHIHPTSTGYAIIAGYFRDAINSLL